LCSALVMVAAAAAACSSTPPSPSEVTRSASSAIQGGSTDTGDNFAVGIEIDLGNGEGAVCSGALLAPNLVATARHCVARLSSTQVDCSTSTFGSLYAANQFIVTNSTILDQNAALYAVSQIVVPTGTDQTHVCGNDIALLILSRNISLPQYVVPAIN